MASLRSELALDAPAETVWNAIRDFGAVDKRVAPGFVVACKLEGDARVVTFANGNEAREELVDLDDAGRRLVYAVKSERVQHYNAALQVLSDGEQRSRLIWTIDLLPNDIAPYIRQQMDAATRVMKPALEGVQT